jgi:hypothetical protein
MISIFLVITVGLGAGTYNWSVILAEGNCSTARLARSY